MYRVHPTVKDEGEMHVKCSMTNLESQIILENFIIQTLMIRIQGSSRIKFGSVYLTQLTCQFQIWKLLQILENNLPINPIRAVFFFYIT